MKADIFLNEPIIKVLTLQYNEQYEKDWHNACLYIQGTFEYHVTEGYWLLLETEKYYVTIGYDGVQKYKKPYEFSKEQFVWWCDSDEEWIAYEETLFVGQKIQSVESQKGYQLIYFDNFKLDLYVYGETDEFNLNSAQFGDGINVMTVGGHLLKKCKCGGNAELLCDEHSDFAVRCSVCHKATYFDMILQGQIDEWNNGNTPCVIHTGSEKLKMLLSTQKIKYIALSSEPYRFDIIDKTTCCCSDTIICFEKAFFNVSSRKDKGDIFDFTGSILSDYNRAFWSNVVTPTDSILFIGELDYENRKMLHFKLDNTDLYIEATCSGLVVWFDKEQDFLLSK